KVRPSWLHLGRELPFFVILWPPQMHTDRHSFAPSDLSFRQVRFSFPFDVFFPRDCERSGDGPDPEPWVTAIGNLLVPKAPELRSIYMKYINPSSFKYINSFPRSAPILSFDPPPPLKYPQVELSPPDVKTVTDDANKKFLTRLRKLFTFELSQD